MAERTAQSTYLSPKFVETDVNGRQLRFYAISVALIFRMRSVAGPVLAALVEMMSASDNDVAVEERSTNDTIKGLTGTERVIGAMSPQLLRERHAIRQATTEKVVATLFSEDTRKLVFQAFVDSLRDEYVPGSWRKEDVTDGLADRCDAPTFAVMLKALFSANDEVIAPFRRQIPARVADGIKKAMSDVGASAADAPAPQ